MYPAKQSNLVFVLLIFQTIFHVSAPLLLTFLFLTSKNSTGILPLLEKKNSSKIWKQLILCPSLIQMSMKVCLLLSTSCNILQINMHAPTKKASNSKMKQLKKPWISNSILVSIKKRHKLFKSHFLSGDPENNTKYITTN